MSWTERWSPNRLRLLLGAAFLVLVACYGLLASQGALPLMSPDESASFTLARHLGQTGEPFWAEPRAEAFSWLHPRSLVARYGRLLPVGFPLWTVALSAIGWVGNGEGVLWLAAIVCASFLFPFVWILERRLKLSRASALGIGLAVATLPTMIVYGNRSLFTLVPQLAFALWTVWTIDRNVIREGAESVSWKRWFLPGLLAILAIGLRPTEAVWLLPLFVGWSVFSLQGSGKGVAKNIAAICIGALVGVTIVLGIHAWIYGSPFAIGYLFRDLPATVVPGAVTVTASSWWRPLFPYGFSPSQWWQNVRGAWTIGWWPWIALWTASIGVWSKRGWKDATKPEKAFFVWLAATTVWLSFYYGQGRFADNVGGQLFHLGNSLFRYQAPFIFGWTAWSLWVLSAHLPPRWNRAVLGLLVVVFSILGAHWAFTDDQDGVLINRAQRGTYGDIRAYVERESPPETIWLSERSDKMVFPLRASVSPLPSTKEIIRFLKTQTTPVWLFRRPPSQQERDRWYAEGLELIQKKSFERENIYEVRLRAGF